MTTTPQSPRAGFIQELERSSGRSIKSRADVSAYLAEVRAVANQPAKLSPAWVSLKRGVLSLGFVLALLQYYMLDVYIQIASLPSITLLAPVSAPHQRSDAEQGPTIGRGIA